MINDNIMGIYQIKNIVNNKFYICSSNNITIRWRQHKNDLNKGKHHNKYLQRSWNKYGGDNFKFEIIELVNDEDLLFSAEQKWINKTKVYDGNIGYNLSIEATRPNVKNVESHLNCNLVYRDSLNKLLELKLDKTEKLVYYTIRDFITYPQNCVLINGEIPLPKELELVTGLEEKTIRLTLKLLEEKGLLKQVRVGRRHLIYVNPEYYASGKELDVETLRMFNIVQCDDEKVESYLES